MLTSQQFCVKWNSYSSNLQSVFPRLLTSEHFVDITLACEGQMIKCHKVVLSACSTYFEKLLVQNPCQHPIIFMKDMKHWEVQALVDFMYKGEVNVSQEELNSLLVAAEALQIRGLCGSDNASRHPESSRQTSSPVAKVSSVTLPNDIVLSGGITLGRDSPPQKKRKIPSEEKDQSLPIVPRISSVTSMSSNKSVSDANSVHASHPSTDQFKDPLAEEFEDELKDKKIKQEMELDEHFLEGDADVEGQEEEAGVVEQPDDSDSNNREDVHSNAILDQPGPSGITTTGPADKAATVEFSWLPKVRPYRQYSNDNLWAALMDVKQGGSVYRASKEHGIPRKTLRNWMKRWNIKSVYSPPVRRAVPPILDAPPGSEMGKGSGVTLTPVVPKILIPPKRSCMEGKGNLGSLAVSSGVNIAPSIPSILSATGTRTRRSNRWLPGCELETNSGVVISPAVPSVLVNPEPDIQLSRVVRK